MTETSGRRLFELEIASMDYLKDRTNLQVRKDIERCFDILMNPDPHLKLDEGGGRLSVRWTNVLESSCQIGLLSLAEAMCADLRLREHKSWKEIGRVLRRDPRSCRRYYAKAMDDLINRMRDYAAEEVLRGQSDYR